MQKAYSRINWENYPSTETPVNETNLNRIDLALDTVDNRVVEFDLTKANQTDLLTCVDGITLNTSTGILTISFKNGTTATIDTGLAKLAVNFDYDEDPTSPHYQQLILEMKDGTYKYIDLSALVTQFEFDNTSTVAFTVNAQTGHISAVVPDGSITANKLDPNVVVTMQAIEDAAEADALKSEGYAVGEQNGVPVGPGSPYYENNAKYYAEEAQGGGSGGHVIKDDTQSFTQRTGLKFSGKVSVTDDAIGGNTVVTVEAGGAVPHLIVISETGSTVTATKGTTVISATETSPEHFECDLEMDDPQDIYGTWVIDAILAGDDAQVSLNVDTIKVYTVDDSHFHADITVTYPDGATVSCSKTGEQTMYATGSPYTFTVHSTGVWTITGTRNGVTETQTVTITTNGQEESITLTILPDGSTITPTDDVQILLNCADIWDKTSYTTIADLLADDTSLLKVLTSDNAIDYLVRSTTFASAVTADEDAMAMIGSYDYCADTLLSDSTWAEAIASSTYASSIIITNPNMTSDTTPSGQVVYHSQYDAPSRYGKNAFDGDESTVYTPEINETVSNYYIGYIFPKSVKLFKASITANSASETVYYDNAIYGGNDLNNLVKISGNIHNIGGTSSTKSDVFNLSNSYTHFIVKIADSNSSSAYIHGGACNWVNEIKYYGRMDGGVQSWLKAGGIDKNYTTLAEVLADTTTLSALIASQDAVDYLVTAKGLIDGIVADSNAMSYIGLNNYCANTLLADADWADAIAKATNIESVSNVKVPTMTSATTPSGTVISNGVNYATGYDPWKAFRGATTGALWCLQTALMGYENYCGYIFTSAVKIFGFKMYRNSANSFTPTIKVQGSNDGTTWNDVYTIPTQTYANKTWHIFGFPLSNAYTQYRVYGVFNGAGSDEGMALQFYGREDV